MRQQRCSYVLALQSLAVLAVLGPASAFTLTAPATRMQMQSTSLGRHGAAIRMMMAVNNNSDEENESSASAPPLVSSASSSLDGENDDDLVTSRNPHKLKNKRGAFLGFRNAKDVPGWAEMRASSYAGSMKAAAAAAAGGSSTGLQSSMQPLMPDGGLSPCVIRVLGVGGGGCNAVRTVTLCYMSIYIETIQEPVK
jgi:hypothetical protein